MALLWTISNLQRLEYSIRRKIVFYAPLTENGFFLGIDPLSYTRAGTTSVTYRGGSKTIAANYPPFEFSGETPLGWKMVAGQSFSYNAANNLNNANTLIWFEDRVPKSTPTNGNPFDAGGNWTGNLNVRVSHVAKANSVLATSEITATQTALLDVAQVIPEPPAPPVANIGTPITETPSGNRNGSNYVFTLSQTPDLGSLELFWGGLYLKRVASAPDTLEYTASGVGNRTLTLGSAPAASEDLTAVYFTIA